MIKEMVSKTLKSVQKGRPENPNPKRNKDWLETMQAYVYSRPKKPQSLSLKNHK